MALHVGGVGGRWQLLLAGSPLIQASIAEQRSSPDEVVLSPQAWALAGEACRGQPLPGGYLRLTAADASWVPRARSRPLQELGDAVQAYVPEVVRARLAAGQAAWLAELRRVTAVFLNLLDVDPAAANLLEPVQLAMAAIQPILQRYEGNLKQVVVDDKGLTLIAVFGLPPLAHEDDPARAAQATLAAQAALRELGLRCAIGLATGRAFCGAVGSDLRREYDVIGEVMNLAARLMQAAPDMILCDAATYQAAHAGLQFQALPAVSVKGKTAPVMVYRPVEPARKTDSRPPIVGRASERATLLERVRALEEGTSGLVVIDGEPGIGKSRLLADLLQRAQARGLRSLAGAGDAIEKITPYYAWRPIFTQLLGLAGIDDLEERRARVLARLPADPALARLAPLLNSVLPLEMPDNDLSAQLAGEVRADNTRELLVQVLQTAATTADGDSPLLVVLDDAHWLDSASWALARRVAMRVRPLLLVLATRPLVEPLPDDYRRIQQDPTTEHLRLEPLSPHDVLALVCDRLGVRHLPEPVAALIEERAQGNPFFSEELAYALRDAGLIRITDGVCAVAPGAGALSSVSFPDTMQGIVAARIDRLSPGQELTLKVASVVGRLFTFRILLDVHPVEADKGALHRYLEDLQRQDFTVLETPEPDLSYLFKHVVTQEVAYGLLLYAQRRQLHHAVAEWYERSEGDDLPPLYPLLAYHWGRAEEPTKTLAYVELAGEQALRAGAYQEAVNFFTQALSLARAVRPTPEALRQAHWHRQLGDAYMGLGRLRESRQHVERTITLLGWPVPATPLRLLGDLVVQGLRQGFHRVWPPRTVSGAGTDRGALLEASAAYERLTLHNYFANARVPGLSTVLHSVNLAERAGPSPELARAFALMSVVTGNLLRLDALATNYCRWAREIAQEVGDLLALASVPVATSAYDISVGNWTSAHDTLSEALGVAQLIGDQRRWGELAALLAQVLYHQGQFSRLAEWSAEMHERASHADDPQRKAHALLVEVYVLMAHGGMDAAVAQLQQATELLADRGSRADEILAYGLLARAYLRRQDEERARLAAQQAASLIAQSQPVAMHILEGYAAIAEVYLSLWAAGDRTTKRPARQACAALRRFARPFPFARPRTWLCQGQAAYLSGQRRRALAAWRKSLATAERLAMPYEQGRAHYELGQHLPATHPARPAHLSRACEIFEDIGAPYELAHAQAALGR
jgi:class 3 adenylate cyclase/tetratricopeptide (TPR) repeat protein